MNSIARRIAAVTVMAATPALIALGAATASQAQGTTTNNGPSISHPTTHQAFPHQSNLPKPGTPEHH